MNILLLICYSILCLSLLLRPYCLHWAIGFMSQSIMNCVTVLSTNCRGLHNIRKRVDVLTHLKELNHNIVYLEDTNWTKKDMASVSKMWGGKCYIHGTRTSVMGDNIV